MPVKILLGKPGKPALPGKERITIGDNPCLPQIIADTFKWEVIGLEFTDERGIVTEFGACRKGNKIVMLPHFSYGPAADHGLASEILKSLKNQGYFCEWRLFTKASDFLFTDKITTILPLEADTQHQFLKLDANVKRKIKKCTSNGIYVKSGKLELLTDFYEIYSLNMHHLGSPALPRRWFANLLKEYSNGEALVWCAYLNNKPVGAAFLLSYRGFYEACWFSTLREYNSLYTSYGLYWTMIHYAVENKGIHFSFGRSTQESGVHKYKQQWGGTDIPLAWNYSHPQGRNIRSFTFLTRLWKLLPYPIAKFAGPFVAGRFY